LLTRRSLAVVFFESLQKFVGIVWCIVLHDILWIMRVNLVDVLAQLAARFGFNFLNSLEPSTLHECALRFQVLR
jgi:hypothetical protein